MNPIDAVPWHSKPTHEAVHELRVDPRRGLTPEEVRDRLARFGRNEMTARRGTPAWLRFAQQFNQALVYILLAATVISAALGEWVDAAVIFAVVLVNAVIGYIQEAKAEKAIEALGKMVRTEATVRRDGHKQRVASAELVPGDVVLLQSGDRVPADLRLVEVRSLQVEEAALTGESVPTQKNPEPVSQDTGVGDRANMAFAGTSVTYGQAEGVVCATGDRTEMGRIATMLSEAVDLSTPLTRKIAEFSRFLLYLILGIAALAVLVGLLRGNTLVEMFMVAVALAVGAIPEGLPAAVTITLAIGVSRMARRNALIRKMPAVETLGSTTVICSDKTGTLTENQMTVTRIWAGGRVFAVDGAGYDAAGTIRAAEASPDQPAQEDAVLQETLRAGLLCNDSQLARKDGRLRVEGDPTEAALIVAARKAGLEGAEQSRQLPRLDVIPFESEHMYMATLHRAEGGHVIYVKGSSERLLERCANVLDQHGNVTPLDRGEIERVLEQLTRQGLRVLAFARRRVPAGHTRLSHQDLADDLTLLGLQGMIDPPRAEAIRAVAECQKAGIAVKMITGDHPGTATAIGRQMGLGKLGPGAQTVSCTGAELEKLPEAKFTEMAERASVFARVAPEQKLRLVRALQSRGHIVAMTGDGVNDAPALKQADIGVAMGITGTDVAQGAADMILTDDNFASIEAAVEEGRNVFDNLTKFIAWTLPTNAGEGLIILASIVAGTVLPVLPVQLLWINMTTAVLLGLTLVFEPKEAGLMSRPPRKTTQPILTRPLLFRVAWVSLLMTAGGFALFIWEKQDGTAVETARTVVVNVIVMVEVFYLLNCRSLTRSFFSLGFFTNRWLLAGVAAMLGAQLLFTYAPIMNRLFHSAPISGTAWLMILAVGSVVFLIIEITKWMGARRRQSRGEVPEAGISVHPNWSGRES